MTWGVLCASAYVRFGGAHRDMNRTDTLCMLGEVQLLKGDMGFTIGEWSAVKLLFSSNTRYYYTGDANDVSQAHRDALIT